MTLTPLRAVVFALMVLITACNPQGSVGPDTQLELDTLVINGLVYDGTDGPGRRTAIGIKDDRISFVGDHNAVTIDALRVIDAKGLLVVPGFIDPHTHSLAELLGPETKTNFNYLTQAVTTVIVGNDGDGGYEVKSLADSLEVGGTGTNVAFLVGHGTVREAVMGRDNRAPSAVELEQMRALVGRAMKEGALGLSSGLYYAPGHFSAIDEVVELAKMAAQYGGLYESHIRDESSYSIGFLAALNEAIDIGRRADLPVHIAHIKALGVDVWGESDRAIEVVEAAREQGLRVTADQYPWSASGTHLRNTLIPRWALAGTFEEYQQRLQDPQLLPEIQAAMADNLRRRGGADSLLLVTCPRQEYLSKTLAEVASMEGVSPIEAALSVLRLGRSRVVSFNMDKTDIVNFMSRPWVMTSSDGTDGHPRKYASFPKKYRAYVVDQEVLSLQSFVHRSSGLTADTFGLVNRGYLKPGYFADIAILNPETYGPQADYMHWNTLSSGVEYLYVNGVLSIEKGTDSEALAGRPLLQNRH